MAGARRSSETLDMLLLSLLATTGKRTGYQLAAILKEPVPLIWPVKHSQIYPALAKLEQRGDVLGKWVAQAGKPDKRIYGLTAQGRKRLTGWCTQPRDSFSQDEIMLIAYNIAQLGAATVKDMLTRYKAQCEAEKRLLEERWKVALGNGAGAVSRDPLTAAKLAGVRSSYEFALMSRDAWIGWCDRSLQTSAKVVAAQIKEPT